MNKRTNFSDQQKTTYLIGNIISGIGIFMFTLNFILFAINFGNFDNFDQQARRGMFLSFGGMFLIIIGTGIKSIAKKGLAGSGLFLDTEQEIEDLEPLNRMKGKQLNHTLEEVNLKEHLGLKNNEIIKIRCQSCKHLNDEHDNFCGGCGVRI
ncbi:MAG: hypothetical protein ACJA1N_002563 [Saprospiraceae bacterium]|jgi:hypothetical protein